jgi:hypothetical protein
MIKMRLKKLIPLWELSLYVLAGLLIAILGTIGEWDWWKLPLIEAAHYQKLYGDPTSFASAAVDIAHYGWVSDATRWIVNLWPPGFMLIEAAILKLLGDKTPILIVLLGLSLFTYAWLLFKLRTRISSSIGSWSWLLPLAFFATPITSAFIFYPTALLFGEWLSIACFIGGILCLLDDSKRASYAAGVLIASAAYVRPQYEVMAKGMLLYALLMWGWLYIRQHKRALPNLVLALLIAQAVMLPWRLYHWVADGNPAWTFTDGLRIELSLKDDASLIAGGGGFEVTGGINVACHLEPVACGSNSKNAYFRIFFSHPWQWVVAKAQILPKYWFASVSNFTAPADDVSSADILINSVYLLLLFAVFYLNWSIRKLRVAQVFWCANAGVMLTYGLVFLFAHFEVRFFFFLKVYALAISFLLFSVWYERRTNSARKGSPP